MAGPRRDIMVLINGETMSPRAIELAIEHLNNIIFQTETPEQFCQTHELVVRNKITSNPLKMLKLLHKAEPGAFRFLICKN